MELETFNYKYRLVYKFFPVPYKKKDADGYFYTAGYTRGIVVECSGMLFQGPWYFLPDDLLGWGRSAV